LKTLKILKALKVLKTFRRKNKESIASAYLQPTCNPLVINLRKENRKSKKIKNKNRRTGLKKQD